MTLVIPASLADRFERDLADVRYLDWTFAIGQDGPRCYLQVRFLRPCNVAGGPAVVQRGRKWFLSEHMTRAEVVQTALLAVLTAVEHEAREQFTYRSRAIFGPHLDVDALVEFADTHAEARRP